MTMVDRMLSAPEDTPILIVGVSRNCARTIDADVRRLSEATRSFSHRKFFIVESDSQDDTVEKLAAISRYRGDFSYHSCGSLSSSMPLRTQRLAFCRNMCSDWVKTQSCLAGSLVLVADLDGINDKLTETALLSCWTLPVRWDVCTSNRRGRYYDIFALRCSGWIEEDCIKQANRLERVLDRSLARRLAVESRMIVIPPDHLPIEVDSAFGGVGLYRAEAFTSGTYVGVDEEGQETCEHVSLHREIRSSGGKIYINPQMLSGGRREFFGKGLLRLFRQSGS